MVTDRRPAEASAAAADGELRGRHAVTIYNMVNVELNAVEVTSCQSCAVLVFLIFTHPGVPP